MADGSLTMAVDGNITKDDVYDAVAPDDFESMLELDRYNNRSTAFDKIISRHPRPLLGSARRRTTSTSTSRSTWRTRRCCPRTWSAVLQTNYGKEMLADPKTADPLHQRLRRCARFSSILHGEQGALNLSASLCHVLYDQGAQEYAANQTREEARHVTAFAKYIKARWGRPVECSPVLKNLLVEIISSPEVYKKIIGMQMLVEGLAMGAFATFYQKLNDPLGRKLMQLVMTDEAFHHKFGKIWADRTIPKLTEEEHVIIEDWAAHCFQTLLFNLVAPVRAARPLRGVRPRPGPGDRRVRRDRHRREPPRGHEGSDQHLPGADQDPAQRRHHHRPHPRLLRHVRRHGRAEGRGRPDGRRRHRRGRHRLSEGDQLPRPGAGAAARRRSSKA